ncbi:MAG TPA: signal peptidase I [Actinomycetales bacterium]|nr:signal peptidase I [Actinomycetales bacterium]
MTEGPEPGDASLEEHPAAEEGTDESPQPRRLTQPRQPRRTTGLLVAVRETVVVVGIALVLSLLVKTFLVQAFYIPSVSMESTLDVGDRVVVSKLTPGPFHLQRGDVIVFTDPGGWLDPTPPPDDGPVRKALRSALTFVGLLPEDSNNHLIKRLIGLPGDHVVCCDAQGRLSINGRAVNEPYVFDGNVPSERQFDITVPPGRVWVMGDHRQMSSDSRYHDDGHGNTGSVPIADVTGRAFVIVWPFNRLSSLPRYSSTFDDVPPPRAP